MSREIERRVLLNMINKHIKNHNPNLKLYTYKILEKTNPDLYLSLKGIQGCFDVFLEAFNQYIDEVKLGKF